MVHKELEHGSRCSNPHIVPNIPILQSVSFPSKEQQARHFDVLLKVAGLQLMALQLCKVF